MKLLFAGLLFIAPYHCHRYPNHTKFICGQRPCESFVTENSLTIEFTGAIFFYTSDKKKSIAIECAIHNKTSDSLLLDSRDFSISSNNSEYDVVPGRMAEAFNVKSKSDVFKIGPGITSLGYYFAFVSRNKMSEKEYNDILFSDTINFKYSGSNYHDTILQLIGSRY